METLKATLIGVAPLLMHNGQLADPLNPHAQALKVATSKRKKTEEDIELIRRLEWTGGLYLDHKGIIGLPADVVLATVVGGARKSKLGKDALAGIVEAKPFFPLKYDGPTDIGELYMTPGFVDYRGVRVQQSRVMRARPRFNNWSLSIELLVDTDVIDTENVYRALEAAGQQVGLAEYRPRFGRFEVKR